MAQHNQDLLEERIRARNEMIGTLNEQQREQYRHMMENMRRMGMSGGGEGMGRGGMGPGGVRDYEDDD